MTKVRLGRPSLYWLGLERRLPALPDDRKLSPIAVMSFNRPNYLRQVLESLAAQRQDLGKRRIVLYQDGAVSPITGRRFAEDADIEACRELFRRLIPWGTERVSEVNLGIAKNFRRAETELFADPANDIVYFFEDDLVLHPHYLDLLDRLALKTERLSVPVGYFSAYGAIRDTLRNQYRGRYRLQRMSFHWAFGLRRSHWLRMQPQMAEYFGFVEHCDYRDRDTPGILRHFAENGVLATVSSQDDVKKAVSYKLGAVSLSTSAAAGRYVGALGEHMDQAEFDRRGYADTQWLDRVEYDWEVPSRRQLESIRTIEIARRVKELQSSAMLGA